ncbi:MAG: hypothetical protein ACI8T1_000794 [Verrucomicrobiales bacterium]|jgi:hypothetical protein
MKRTIFAGSALAVYALGYAAGNWRDGPTEPFMPTRESPSDSLSLEARLEQTLPIEFTGELAELEAEPDSLRKDVLTELLIYRWVKEDPEAAVTHFNDSYRWNSTVWRAWMIHDPKATLVGIDRLEPSDSKRKSLRSNGLGDLAGEQPEVFLSLVRDLSLTK